MTTNKLLTIVTPSYNRAYILEKCYKSLKKQTFKCFIWMIIDDGSTDNTEDLVNKWINENSIEIKYYKKDNGGKALALNIALDKVKTEYFTCLDSDDWFSYNAVELAIEKWNKIRFNEKYCGLVALRTDTNNNVLGGKTIPKEVKEITIQEISNKYRIKSEVICFYKSNIICKYRFPEIEGEKFISPAYLEQEIGKKYKYIVSQDILCYCEYLDDGLTKNKNKIIINNPKGYTLVKRQSFELAKDFKSKSKHAVLYIAGSILSKDKRYIKNSPNKLMTIIYTPIGLLVYFLRFKKKLK